MKASRFEMHIVFVVPRFYPYPGGYENYVLALARSLKSNGNTVTVFTTNAFDLEYFWIDGPRSLPAGRESLDGIDIYRFPICHRRWLRRAGRLLALLPQWRLKAQFAPPSFRVIGLREALSKAPVDLLHVGSLPYNRLMYEGIWEARRRGIPVLSTPCTHFGEDTNEEISRHYTQKFQIAMLNQCNFVLALTEVERQRLIGLGLSPRKTVLTGAGIDPVEVSSGNSQAFRTKYGVQDPIVLHLGMKALDKGSICVVDSMKRLWREGSQAWLVLAGPSSLSFDEYLGASDSKFDHLLNLGPVSHEEKRDLLAASSVLVQPSRVESLGLVCLEAWANAKPVIVADTAVMRELIEPGGDGLLVPFGDSKALASAIQELLDNRDKRVEMGLQGQQKCVSRFAWDTVVERIHPYFKGERREKSNSTSFS